MSAENPEEFQDATDQHSFKKMLPRDERRFKSADLDGDLAATREEFTAFLHPEEFEHMKNIVVLVSKAKSMPLFALLWVNFEGFSHLSRQGLGRDTHITAKWGTERGAFLGTHLV